MTLHERLSLVEAALAETRQIQARAREAVEVAEAACLRLEGQLTLLTALLADERSSEPWGVIVQNPAWDPTARDATPTKDEPS